MSATTTSPARKPPGDTSSPTLRPWNVTVTSRATAAPGHLAGRGVDARGDVDRDDGGFRTRSSLDQPRRLRRAARRGSRCRTARRSRPRPPERASSPPRGLPGGSSAAIRPSPPLRRRRRRPRSAAPPATAAAPPRRRRAPARSISSSTSGSPLLRRAHLVGGVERLEHRGRATTADGAASSRECVIERSIRPAPTCSAHARAAGERDPRLRPPADLDLPPGEERGRRAERLADRLLAAKRPA